MATLHDYIDDSLRAFIARQHLFFVATAPLSGNGHVNLSPKGLDSFRVLAPRRVGYMDLVSSGNETSAHVLENGRITLMFCSFDGPPQILRLYGCGRTVLPADPEWATLAPQFTILASTRQVIVADITRIQTSCGFGVPRYTYEGERDQHQRWAASKGPDGIAAYRRANNLVSLDGLPTALGLAEPG